MSRVILVALAVCGALLSVMFVWAGQPAPAASFPTVYPAISIASGSDVLHLPFAAQGHWIAGQTHAHVSPHSELSFQEAAYLYRSLGQGFLSITEHDRNLAPPHHDDMIIVRGIEVSANQDGRAKHLIALGTTSTYSWEGISSQQLIDNVRADQATVVIAHPDFICRVCQLRSWEPDVAAALQGAHATEVSGQFLRELTSDDPLASDHVWLRVLSQGRLMVPLASDDAHTRPGYGPRAVVVQAMDRDPGSVVDAIARGRVISTWTPMPGSQSVWPERIETSGNGLNVTTRSDQPAVTIVVRDARGFLRATVDAPTTLYEAVGDEGFLVVAMRGQDGAVAVLAPIAVGARPPSLGPADDVDATSWDARPSGPSVALGAALIVGAGTLVWTMALARGRPR